MNWLIVVVGFLLLVLIHELGHFLVALSVGMRPPRFSVGFGPALAKVRYRGVEYRFGAIPLGGYVRIPGMHRPAARDVRLNLEPALHEDPELAGPVAALEHALDAEDQAAAHAAATRLRVAVEDAQLAGGAKRLAERGVREAEEGTSETAYWRQPIWKRIAIILAGPATNVVFAIVVLAIVYVAGAPTPEAAPTRVAAVQAHSPASAAGLRPGDVIVAIGGKRTPTFSDVRRTLEGSGGKTLQVTVRRRATLVRLRPEAPRRSDGTWKLGFVWDAPASAPLRSYPVGRSIAKASSDCWQVVTGTVHAIGGLFHKQQRGQLTSIVGMADASHQALRHGFRDYLQLLAIISLGLGLMNLLPLLPLDGGHILFSLLEGVRRRAVPREVYERASVVGLALLLMVVFIALNNDYQRLFPG